MDTEDAPAQPPLPPRNNNESQPVEAPPEPPLGVAPAIEKGAILAFRLYDVASEIDLRQAEKLLKSEVVRLKLVRENAQYLELPNPPASVTLGSRSLALKRGTTQVEVRMRLFDHGAMGLLVRIPVATGTPFETLVEQMDEVYDCPPIDALCREEAKRLVGQLNAALRRPHIWEGDESYTVAFVEKLEGDPTADELLHRCDLARLLLGEKQSVLLSPEQRAEVLQSRHSYTRNDLAVIDWNSAFVYEPSGTFDIPDLLEIVNAQLLELRYYDSVLDRELNTIYDEVNQAKRPWWALFSSRYGKLRRHTLALLLELGEFTERVENSLKIIGDFYLARIYRGAVRRFRIEDWEHSVYRKQGLVAQVYNLLKSEVDTDRLLWLEITVVLLILGELLLALHIL
jgi:hypothetical protein